MNKLVVLLAASALAFTGCKKIEITPKNIRLRKRLLTMNERARSKKAAEKAG